MKRILFFSLIAVLISPGSARAVLSVEEYIPGEKVTLDENTGNYWYWNLPDFVNMTYDEQISAIAGLGTYGNIGGGWHMATLAEMEALWNNHTGPELATAFATTNLDPVMHQGRYDQPGFIAMHSYVYLLEDGATKSSLGLDWAADSSSHGNLSAWITTEAQLIPVPGALMLTATGLLSMLGFNRWRRKH